GARKFILGVNGIRLGVGLCDGVVWQRDQFFPFEGIAEGTLQFGNAAGREHCDLFLKMDFRDGSQVVAIHNTGFRHAFLFGKANFDGDVSNGGGDFGGDEFAQEVIGAVAAE
ncbi:hypothetical protein WDZ92_13040, partial [Nostoc sp. NIES-2111]